jgi:alkaline phosphatase D
MFKELQNSTSNWNLIGNQEMMGSWLSSKSKVIKLPGDGTYFDPGNWDGYAHDRKRLFDFIKESKINNVIVLTGDAHMSFVTDLTTAPRNRKIYNRKTGEGAVGVEFLPTSISRGNMDESGVPKEFIPLFQSISKGWNPQHRFCQFSKHGYGTLDITKERCVAEFWYSPILSMQDVEFFGRGYTVKSGVNHWERKFNKRRSKSTFPQ